MPTRQTLLAPSAKRREVLGELMKGELRPSMNRLWGGLSVRVFLHKDDRFEILDIMGREGCVHFRHSRAIDPCIHTTPGRSMSGFTAQADIACTKHETS